MKPFKHYTTDNNIFYSIKDEPKNESKILFF